MRALTVWDEALGAEWPLANPLIDPSAMVEANRPPKQAPSMDLDTVRKIEQLTAEVDVNVYKRACASGILLVTYASLRFSGVRGLDLSIRTRRR